MSLDGGQVGSGQGWVSHRRSLSAGGPFDEPLPVGCLSVRSGGYQAKTPSFSNTWKWTEAETKAQLNRGDDRLLGKGFAGHAHSVAEEWRPCRRRAWARLIHRRRLALLGLLIHRLWLCRRGLIVRVRLRFVVGHGFSCCRPLDRHLSEGGVSPCGMIAPGVDTGELSGCDDG